MKSSALVVASLLLFAGCVVEPEPAYRRPVVVTPGYPTQVNQQQNNTINENTRVNAKTKVNSTTTINNNVITNHPSGQPQPDASQAVDPSVEKFDKNGNPNYDENGNYIGGHGIGTTVDDPDAGNAEAGENPTPEASEPAMPAEAEPMSAPDPEPAGEPSDSGEEDPAE